MSGSDTVWGGPARAETLSHTPFFGVLGPLEVCGVRGHRDLGPPQRRALLLRLLAEDCRPVSVGRICEDLWHGNPPSSAASSVHAHISRLRSALEESSAGRTSSLLINTSTGYVLRVPPDRRDTVAFENAIKHGHRLAEEGHTDRARQTLEQALELWRGQPYADAQAYLFARQETDRLTELHWSARHLRARLLLGEGRVEQAVAASEELVDENPLRETSWVTLLHALHAAGRIAEALQRYEEVRRTLADTLGTDPGPPLRRAHLALLRQEPAAIAPGIGVRSVERSVAPAPRSPLTGRGRQLATLEELLARAGSGRTVWAVLHGAAGTGKSRLLREFGRIACGSGAFVVHDRYPKHARPGTGPRQGGAALRVLEESRAVPRSARHAEPVLCLVDDVQGAPPEDREALAAYADVLQAPRLMVVCAVAEGRDPAVAEFQARLARCGARLIEVGPLDVVAVEDLLRAQGPRGTGYSQTAGDTAGAGGPDSQDGPGAERACPQGGPGLPGAPGPLSAAAARLHALTGGNAFYLTELLRGPAGLSADTPIRVPHVVRCEVRARMATLAPDAQRVVDAAAVLSSPVEAAFLARACELSLTVVLRALDEAASVGVMTWLPVEDLSLPASYAFSCDLIRSALLTDMPQYRAHAARRAVARANTARAVPSAGPTVCRPPPLMTVRDFAGRTAPMPGVGQSWAARKPRAVHGPTGPAAPRRRASVAALFADCPDWHMVRRGLRRHGRHRPAVRPTTPNAGTSSSS
ncbi:BTAD domain-containing putative transcriptional regulator [Streptomyces sp. NPDC050625]|uniref:BTAD domain-containing putative transcriptional regulator n=1 Tax=Streptomyces sp. NPDC050625 TaxID=3154629 RepID=UPI00342794E5